MSATDTKIEISQTQTRVWVLGGVVAGLLLVLQAILTLLMTNATAKMDGYSTNMARCLTALEVMAVRNEALTLRVTNLETARADAAAVHETIDKRLNSLEQRAAVYDQFIQVQKFK